MTGRRMGVEEELLLVDDEGLPRGVASSVLRVAGETAEVDSEFLDEQLETGTEPCTGAEELADELRRRRRAAGDAAATSGARVAALATSPVATEGHLSPGERYRRIVDAYGLLASEQLSSGCHTHVEVTDLEEGVGVLDRIGPWLPVLRALTANSPYWHGTDTGYESYRSTVWNRWPSAGPPGPFGSLAGYDRAVTSMVESGALLDEGMVYFDARLSRALSTVELRVADVCLEVDDAVLYAVLARALVTTEARRWREGAPPSALRHEVLALAHWRAARSGLTDVLVDPMTATPAPAHVVLERCCEHVADALSAAGDSDLVEAGRGRLRERGTGATTQRAVAREHDGDLTAVVRAAAAITLGGTAADATGPSASSGGGFGYSRAMTSGREDPVQPQVRNPAADPDTSPEKQSELKLNVGIGVIGTILSIAVAVIFFLVLEEAVLGIVFAVVALVAAGVTAYAFLRRRRGQQ